MDKREFIKSASAATILAAFGLSIESCSGDEPKPDDSDGAVGFTFDLTESPYSQLQTEGQWLLIRNETLLLVNVGGAISAFSSACTHTGCTTNWSFGANATCTCHNSIFNSSGSPISGPAQRPLSRKSVTEDENVITVL
ncbi:MAG: Rieske 2Fe-2S domain-containing protein [Cyclobacteriaceae bacterium]